MPPRESGHPFVFIATNCDRVSYDHGIWYTAFMDMSGIVQEMTESVYEIL